MTAQPYFKCRCCTHGIARYYKATVFDGLPTPSCDDCPELLELIFDFQIVDNCQTLLVNGHPCYTPLVLTFLDAETCCLRIYNLFFVGPGHTGLNADVEFESLPDYPNYEYGIEECLEPQILLFKRKAGDACDYSASTVVVVAIPPDSLFELTNPLNPCWRRRLGACRVVTNPPWLGEAKRGIDSSCTSCGCDGPQPVVPGSRISFGGGDCGSAACGASVNVTNGNLSVVLGPPGSGPESPPLAITINSQWGAASSLGHGGSSLFTQKVVWVNSTSADVLKCDGSVYFHRCKNGDSGIYVPPSDCTDVLKQNTDGSWTETTANLTKFDYNSEGRLYKITNACGEEWNLSVPSGVPLRWIANPSGRRTSFSYDSGKIRRIQDIAGRITTFTVDGSGNLTSQMTPELCTTTLRYNGDHRITGVIAPDGLRTSFAYDTNGFCSEVKQPDGGTYAYDYVDWLTTEVTDPAGQVTVIEHNVPRQITKVTSPLAGVQAFAYRGNRLTSYTSAAGETQSFKYERRGCVMFLKSTVTPAGRTTFVFDAGSGPPLATIDALGHRTTIVRDGNGLPLATINAMGNRTTTIYDAGGRPVARMNPLGARTTTVYNSDGFATATINPLSMRTTYTYAFGQLVSTENPVGAVTSAIYDLNNRRLAEIDALGNRSSFIYAACAAPVATIRPNGARTTNVYAFGRVKVTINPLGNRTSFTYDLVGRRIRAQSPLGRISTTIYNADGQAVAGVNPSGLRSTTLYDSGGRPKATIDPSGARSSTIYDSCCSKPKVTIDPNGLRTTYVYDKLGNTIRTVQPSGAISTTIYDVLSRPKATIDPLGNRSTSVYDVVGRAIANVNAFNQRSTTVYNVAGQSIASINPLGIRSTQVYDVAGRGIASINPKGNRWTTVYNIASQSIASVDPLNRRSTSVYNNVGAVTASVNPAGSRSTTVYNIAGQTIASVDAKGSRSTVTYNPDGQTVASINALGFRTTQIYDVGGRGLASVDAKGSRSTTVYGSTGRTVASINPLGKRWTTIYATSGRVLASLDPLGNRNSSVYDSAGRTVASVNPLGNRMTTVYNIASQNLATIDANGNRVSSVYDALGRRTAEVNALGNRTTTVYDTAGQTSALIDARANRHSFTYDSTGAQTQLIDPLNRRRTSAFDAAGQQNLRIDARSNRTTFAYSSVGQLTGRKYPDGSRATFSYDTVGHRTLMADSTGRYTATYDAVGQTMVTASPNNQRMTYAYDPVGARGSMDATGSGRFTYSYNAAGQLSALLNPFSERTTFSYDDAGRRTVQRNANGTRVSMAYDAASQSTQVFHRKSDGSSLLQLDYKYDPAGNRIGIAEDVTAARTTWSYDKQNQLTGENRTGTNAYRQTFTYDAGSNRTLKNVDGTRTTYAYAAANQLKYGQAVAGRTTYTYDLTGNQKIEQPPTGNRTTTTWNYENQPTLYQLASGGRVTMAYNGDNRRVISQQSTETTKFVWDSVTDAYVSELDGSNVLIATYTNEPQQYGGVLSQRRGTTSHFLHADALGTTRLLTDNTQGTTNTYLYDAWGNLITSSGTTVNPFCWVGRCGYYQDASTGLVYVRARMYVPVVARWGSVDPLRSADGLNLYSYVRQNPTSLIDPSGLISVRFRGCTSGGLHEGDCQDIICGDRFAIWWDFVLDADAPCEGYIVQKVDIWCLRHECWDMFACPVRMVPVAPTFSFLEAFPVAQKKRKPEVSRQPGTDGAEGRLFDPGCGDIIAVGVAKFYCSQTYQDKALKTWPGIGILSEDPKWNIPGRAFGKGTGCATGSGRAPSISGANLPEWWKDPSFEKQGYRHLSYSWNCCCQELSKTSFSINFFPDERGGHGVVQYPKTAVRNR